MCMVLADATPHLPVGGLRVPQVPDGKDTESSLAGGGMERPTREKTRVSYKEFAEDEAELVDTKAQRKGAKTTTPPPVPAATPAPEKRPLEVEEASVSKAQKTIIVEVRQQASMANAYYIAQVLNTGRADGLVEVQYKHLHHSALHDSPLTEWIQPTESDELRPIPPVVASDFHETLKTGAQIEVRAAVPAPCVVAAQCSRMTLVACGGRSSSRRVGGPRCSTRTPIRSLRSGRKRSQPSND